MSVAFGLVGPYLLHELALCPLILSPYCIVIKYRDFNAFVLSLEYCFIGLLDTSLGKTAE